MLHLRRAEEDDIPFMVELLHLLFSIEEDFSFDAKKQAHALGLLLQSSSACLLIADLAGEKAGMASGQLIISTAEGKAAVVVEDVVVTPKRQGQGIGRALLAGLEKWAEERGAERLQLLIKKTTQRLLFTAGLGGNKQHWWPCGIISAKKRSPINSNLFWENLGYLLTRCPFFRLSPLPVRP